MGVCKFGPSKEKLIRMTQETKESLRDWMQRYSTKLAKVVDALDVAALMDSLSSMRSYTIFNEDLRIGSTASLSDFITISKKIMNA